jgi:hypothetical protein
MADVEVPQVQNRVIAVRCFRSLRTSKFDVECSVFDVIRFRLPALACPPEILPENPLHPLGGLLEYSVRNVGAERNLPPGSPSAMLGG